MSEQYTALYGADSARIQPRSLDEELWSADDTLRELAAANVHDHAEMIKAASGLYYRLGALAAAVKASQAVGR
jgi:hypothetical protein